MHESSGRFQSRDQNLENYFRGSDLAESTELFCDLFDSAWGEGGQDLFFVFFIVFEEKAMNYFVFYWLCEEVARIICVFLFVIEKKEARI